MVPQSILEHCVVVGLAVVAVVVVAAVVVGLAVAKEHSGVA